MDKNKIVVLSGAGISAESGISTFRDSNGLWCNHKMEEVATPEAFARNPELVLHFYNERRRQLKEAKPNAAHKALAELQDDFDVQIITQNVDDLHERAGSKQVLHLHGELLKVRSTKNPHKIYDWHDDLLLEDKAEDGAPLRPHIVWFGEDVPAMSEALDITAQAECFLIVGTSLQVHPAAGLLHYVPLGVPIYLIDPAAPKNAYGQNIELINDKASSGVLKFINELNHIFAI